MRTIAIIGGGPAGATAAERLVRRIDLRNRGPGYDRVVVYEEKRDWEKPCGGGLSGKALKEYPFLLHASEMANPVWKMEICVPGVVSAGLNLCEPLVVYSRRELNHLLLERSEAAGAEIVEDRILNVAHVGDKWHLNGRKENYEADYLILAAGARSRLRNNLVGALRPQDFMLTYGYFVPAHEDLLRIGFFEDFEGYAWSFPRTDHLSVGICGKAGQNKMSELKQRLTQFMSCYGYSADSATIFSHLLPSLDVDSWAAIRLEGDCWAVVGDAAGLVDPITGEGLYFAIRSGELLAASLLNGCSYARSVWNEFGAKLMLGAQLCPKFYHGKFLGGNVTTRMIQLCRQSRTFLDLLQDLVEGKQAYRGLRRRFFRSLPKFLSEIAAQTLRDGMGVQSAKRE